MSIDRLHKTASAILTAVENSEKFLIPSFSIKLNKMAKAHPEDRTIGQMSQVVAKMSKNMFITRGEIKDLYNKLYTRNTKFATLFAEEIGDVLKETQVKEYSRDAGETSQDLYEKAVEAVVDPILNKALATAFGDEKEIYSNKAADSACSLCKRELSEFGLESEVSVQAGQEDLLICSASFETPRGKTSVLFPIEIQQNKALSPNVFFGNAGAVNLTKENLISYITRNAGSKLNINSKALLKAASNIKNKPKNVSDVEIALTKLNSKREQIAEFTSDNILFQKVASIPENMEVNVPKYEEGKYFEQMLGTSAGIAEFTFGKEKISAAKNNVLSKLARLGFSNIQIKVADVSEKEVIFAVASDITAFKVPVKIADKMVEPTFVIANGSIKSFDKAGLSSLIKENKKDFGVIAQVSANYGLKNSELIDIVRQAMVEKNYAKAEDALNVIQESGDELAFQTAFNEFKEGMLPQKEAEVSKCSFIIKSANSQFPLCGHTNLPLHKVFQDKHGSCLPLHRRAELETYEGATFMAHKILL